MKILLLTGELTEKHGWGRYSIGLLGALSSAGVEVVVAQGLPNPLNYKKNYFLAFLYAMRLKNQAKDCDVIHSLLEPYSYISYLLSLLTGKKYFITVHGTYGVLPYNFPFYKKYFHKKSFENAEKIICVSNYTRKRMEEFGLSNLEVINNGINFKNFSKLEVLPLENREDAIVSVGALKQRKGYHISISAFAEVLKVFGNIKYYIVGDQSDINYFNSLKKLVSDLNIEKSVVFLQSISDDELLGLYGKSKLFVLTSVNEGAHFEGFGLVYLEANARGLPVIGSLDSGAEDAIRDGETGFLVPQNGVSAVTKAVIKILENKNLTITMKENSQKWAKDHNWKRVIDNYINLYKT